MRLSCLLAVMVVLLGTVHQAAAQYNPATVPPSSPVGTYSAVPYPSTTYSTAQAHQPTRLPATQSSNPALVGQQPASTSLGLPLNIVPAASSLSTPVPPYGYPAQPYAASAPYLGDAGCFSCSQQGCDSCCGPAWFVSVSALYMGRDHANSVWTTYETGNPTNDLMDTRAAKTDWQPGGELRFGTRFGRSNWSWEVSYWTLASMNGYASQSHASGVTGAIGISDLEFNGTNATTYFDGAFDHRLFRTNDFHNVELNILNKCLCGNPCSGFSIGGLAGLRYFRFEENLTFGSLCGGAVWHGNAGADEAYLSDNIENDLFGVQFGLDTRWCSCGRWSLFATPKFGIYNNHISNRFHAYRGDGVAATPTAASGVNGSYPIESAKDNIAFLTQLDLGVDYSITSNWSLGLGYRLLVFTGMGLADNQLPTDTINIAQIADIDTNGQLILHGAMVTLTYSR